MNLDFSPSYNEDALRFVFTVTNSELNLIPVTTKVNDLLFQCVGASTSISKKLHAMAYLAEVIEIEAKRGLR